MEYNKKRFLKANDKKVLHKVKKQWVVLSMSLLALLGGGAVAHQITTHADTTNHQNINPAAALKNRINASLMKAQTVSNQPASANKIPYNNQTGTQQITQQANQLHNQILQNADLTSLHSAQSISQSAPSNDNNDRSVSNHLSGNEYHRANGQDIANQVNSSHKIQSMNQLSSQPSVQRLNNELAAQVNQVKHPDYEPAVGESEPVAGQWGTASYLLNGGNLKVVGGQIDRFHDFAQTHPDDPLVQAASQNQVKSITFSDVKAPVDASAFENVQDSLYAFYNIATHQHFHSDDNGEMFPDQESLLSLDASGLDTSGTTNMLGMFGNMAKLQTLKLNGLFNTSNVSNMNGMFQSDQSLSSLDVSGFDTHNVNDMGFMFQSDFNLSALNVSNFDVGKVTSMRYMFWDDSALQSLKLALNTGKVNDMTGMFGGDNDLDNIIGLSDLDTHNVTNMSQMFNDTFSFTHRKALDLRKFNTSKVTNMSAMFQGTNFKKLILGNSFDTSHVTQVAGMFSFLPLVRSIGFSPRDDIDLGNHFDLSNCNDYGDWECDTGNPDDAKNWMSIDSGMFSEDLRLSDVDLNHLFPGADASALISDDRHLTNIDLNNFYSKGPQILSSKGGFTTYSEGQNITHPGFWSVPGIGPDDENPYKNYDMLQTNVSDQGLVSIHLGDQTFKKDPSVDPNQSDHEQNYLDGTFYQITPSDNLLSQNLVDGNPHPGTWFRNKSTDSVIAFQDQSGHVVKLTDAGSQNDMADFRNYIEQNDSTLCPVGYYIPDQSQDVIIRQKNQNVVNGVKSNFVGIVRVMGDFTRGTTMIPAKYYVNHQQVDSVPTSSGQQALPSTVPLYYDGHIDSDFAAHSNQLHDVQMAGERGGFTPDRLAPDPANGKIIAAANAGDPTDFPSKLVWNQGKEPVAIYNYYNPMRPVHYQERVPYEYLNSDGGTIGGIYYVNNGQRFPLDATVNLPTTAPQGYTLDPNAPKTAKVSDYLSYLDHGHKITIDPADGQTNVVQLKVHADHVSDHAAITVRLEKDGVFQKNLSDPIQIKGLVGHLFSIRANGVAARVPQGYVLQDPDDIFQAQINPDHSYRWLQGGDNWDAANGRPALIYNYTTAAPLTVQYVNALDGSDIGSPVTAPSSYVGSTLDLSQGSAFNRAHLPSGYTYDTATGKNTVTKATYTLNAQPAVPIYVDGNVQVRYLKESNKSLLGYGTPDISADPSTTKIQISKVKIPKNVSQNYYINPKASNQNYQIQYDSQTHQHYVNVNMISANIWTGYKWGGNPADQSSTKGIANVSFNGNNDTIYVSDGYIGYIPGFSIGSSYVGVASGFSFFSDVWKYGQSSADDSNVKNLNDTFSSFKLPNNNHDWKIVTKNVQFPSKGVFGETMATLNTAPSGYFSVAGNQDSWTSQVRSIDLSGITNLAYNIQGMFKGDSNLINIKGLDHLDTSDVSDMSNMFNGDSKLSDIDLSTLKNQNNTPKLKNISGMFANDDQLRTLNLGKMDTSNVPQDAQHMGNVFADSSASKWSAGDANLNKLVTGPKTNLKTAASSDYTSSFFQNNVSSNGLYGSDNDQIHDFKNGNQPAGVYYRANPYTVYYSDSDPALDPIMHWKRVRRSGVDNEHYMKYGILEWPQHPDSDYRGKIADQLAPAKPRTLEPRARIASDSTLNDFLRSNNIENGRSVNGYRILSSDRQDYSFQNHDGRCVVVKFGPNYDTFPVNYVDEHGRILNQDHASGYVSHSVNLLKLNQMKNHQMVPEYVPLGYKLAISNNVTPSDKINYTVQNENGTQTISLASDTVVHFIDENNLNHQLNNGSQLVSPIDSISEVKGESLPAGYTIDPDHQSYQTYHDANGKSYQGYQLHRDANGQAYVNVNLLSHNSNVWTGYKWGNANVTINGNDDTIDVNGGGQVSGDIFDNIIKTTKTDNQNDPTVVGQPLTKLPNDQPYWSIKVENAVAPQNGANLFNGGGVTKWPAKDVISINVGGLDTKTNHVNNMSKMFANDSNLSGIEFGDLDTSQVNDMSGMFANDGKLTELILDDFQTLNLRNLSAMFKSDRSLTDLDLSSFDLRTAQSKGQMFDNDNALNKLILNAQTNLSGNGQDWKAKFFAKNVSNNGSDSTGKIKSGTQGTNIYYQAEPVDVRLVNVRDQNAVFEPGNS